MPEQPSHRLPEEFGGNEWLVDELYERYQQDKNTVDAKWWPLFESFDAGDKSSTNGTSGGASAAHPATRELPVVAPAAAAPAAAAEAGGAGGTAGISRVAGWATATAVLPLEEEPLPESKDSNRGHHLVSTVFLSF